MAAATFSSCSSFARSIASRYSRAFSIATAASFPSVCSVALGARQLYGGIEHHDEDVFEDAPGPERAQPLEQARHLPDLVDGRRRVLRRLILAEHEGNFRVVGLSEPDAIAVRQLMFGGLDAVDERAE